MLFLIPPPNKGAGAIVDAILGANWLPIICLPNMDPCIVSGSGHQSSIIPLPEYFALSTPPKNLKGLKGALELTIFHKGFPNPRGKLNVKSISGVLITVPSSNVLA